MLRDIPQLEGKDFIFKLDGRVRNIGEVTAFQINTDRTAVALTVILRDEEAAGILGAAADKAAAGVAPLTDPQGEDLVNGDEWDGQISA